MHKKTESHITLPQLRERARLKSGVSIAKGGLLSSNLTLSLWALLIQRADFPNMEDSRRN